MSAPACRLCGAPLTETFVDLGTSPLANSYLEVDQLLQPESWYPLTTFVCTHCWLVQLPSFVGSEVIFHDHYPYFSSYSSSWVEHARRFAELAIERFQLGPESLVVEAASNDGYLLQHFRAREIPVLGIEPARNVAQEAIRKGIATEICFLGRASARRLRDGGVQANLLVANNVLAHVPDLHDFVAGLELLLAPGGVVSMEFPHLLRLIEKNLFDTIYHEHFSYFAFSTAERVLAAYGLRVFDLEQLPTHGGSLRLYAARSGEAPSPASSVEELRALEAARGLDNLEIYRAFSDRVSTIRRQLLKFLLEAREAGLKVAGYGAPAKANTLLVYCGIRPDLLPFTVDRNPHKQGRYLPGSRIPIRAPEAIFDWKPDFLLILPWNLRTEIVEQMQGIRSWGGKFVLPIPQLEIF